MKIFPHIKKAIFASIILLFLISIRSQVSAQSSSCPTENSYQDPVRITVNQSHTISYDLNFISQRLGGITPSLCTSSFRSCVRVRGCILTDGGDCGILDNIFTPSGQSINSNTLSFTVLETGMINLKYWLEFFNESGTKSDFCNDHYIRVNREGGRDPNVQHICDPGVFSNPTIQGTQNQNITFLDPINIVFNKSYTHNFPALGQYRVDIRNQATGVTISSIAAVGELNGSGNLELRDSRINNGLQTISLPAQSAGLYNIHIVDAGSSFQRCGPYPFSVQDENNSVPDVDINDGSTDTGQPAQSYEIETCNNGDGIVTSIGCVPTSPSELFAAILRLAIGLAGGIAFLLIILGGVRILASAGNPEALNQGREIVTSAIAGLILIIFSVFILRFIGVDVLALPGFSTSSNPNTYNQIQSNPDKKANMLPQLNN